MSTIEGTRNRVEATFGYGHTDWKVRRYFYRHLVPLLSGKFGGLRMEKGDGFWRADGNSTAPYTGELFEEVSVTITFVTDLPTKRAVSILRKAATLAKEKTTGNVPLEWVNVEVTEVDVHHFVIPENTSYLPDGGDTKPPTYDGAPVSVRNDLGPHGY